jgi:protein-S-isoprenylcysteine O-methyltransferase Ste14
MIVEGVCGIGCVISAYAIFTRKRWAQKNALITQILILVGVLAGVVAITRDPGIRTPLNLSLHGIMLVLIVMGLLLLSMSSTAEGFRNNSASRSGEG